MDPLTAALQFATVIAKIVLLSIERQPPELQAAHAKLELERLNRWTALLDRFIDRSDNTAKAPVTVKP